MADNVSMMNMETELFRTVPSRDVLNFGSNGGTDYQKVAEFLNFEKRDLSKMSGVEVKSVRFDRRMPQMVREKLDEIKTVCLLVAEHFEDAEKTALWFKTPNPLLGELSPRDMLRCGRYKKLLMFILNARRRAEKNSGDEQAQDEDLS